MNVLIIQILNYDKEIMTFFEQKSSEILVENYDLHNLVKIT